MKFTWDENKRRRNLRKHDLDFEDAKNIFDKPYLEVPSKYKGVEKRWLAIGKLEEVYVTIVFTIRDNTYRIISMRRAKRNERRRYDQKYRQKSQDQE